MGEGRSGGVGVADRIARTARTGRMGDGKIFEIDMGWPEAIEF